MHLAACALQRLTQQQKLQQVITQSSCTVKLLMQLCDAWPLSLAIQGWTAYIAVLYGLLAVLGVLLGGCVWVGYIFMKYNLAPSKW
jgi:hypothetical protein